MKLSPGHYRALSPAGRVSASSSSTNDDAGPKIETPARSLPYQAPARLTERLHSALARMRQVIVTSFETLRTLAQGVFNRFIYTGQKIRAWFIHEAALRAHEAGKTEKAEALYKTTLDIYRRIHGDNHPYNASVLYNLGDLCHTLERYPEAEEYYQQAYRIEKDSLGESNPRTLKTILNLACFYHDAQRPTDAKTFYRKALSILETASPKDWFALATTEGDLAALLHEQGETGEARQYYNKAIEHYRHIKDASQMERMRQNLDLLNGVAKRKSGSDSNFKGLRTANRSI